MPSPHQLAHHQLRRHLRIREHARTSAAASGLSRPPSSSAWMPAVTNRQSMPKAAAPLRSVRTESPIASTRLCAVSRPRALLRRRHRLLVDRAIRLAGIDHVAALGGIAVGDRAGAIDEMLAALDHDVGIGADHRQLARAHRRDDVVVVVRAFPWCRRTGRSRPRSRRSRSARATRRDRRRSAGRAPGRYGATRSPARSRDQRARHVAGAHDRVVAVARHLEAGR